MIDSGLIYYAICQAIIAFREQDCNIGARVVIEFDGGLDIGVALVRLRHRPGHRKKKSMVTMAKYMNHEVYIISHEYAMPGIISCYILSLIQNNNNGVFIIGSESDERLVSRVYITRLSDEYIAKCRKIFGIESAETQHERSQSVQSLGDVVGGIKS